MELRSSEVIIEALERVPNERQTQLRRLLRGPATGKGLGLENGGVVRLVNLVRREVRGVNVGGETRLERRPNTAQTIELDTSEERVRLDILSTVFSKTGFRVANQAKG